MTEIPESEFLICKELSVIGEIREILSENAIIPDFEFFSTKLYIKFLAESSREM